MRIAQIAPLWERVPPLAYGGTELVVSLLTDELVRRGHDVMLFATGDSETLAKLERVYPHPFRHESEGQTYKAYEALELIEVYEKADEFDIIHSHVGYPALPYASLIKTPTVHTLHLPVAPGTEELFIHAHNQNYVSISNAQREIKLGLNYVATVYNGIDSDRYVFHPQPDPTPYLAFLGRMAPEKGPHLAIAIAKRAGWKLKMCGQVNSWDAEFFATEVKPHIDGDQIEYLGEANQDQKSVLLGGAVATLFPITWEEPFGLVMVESMAVGTPVIAMNRGSVPEVIATGKSGFICNDLDECVAAIDKAAKLDRHACREHLLKNFTLQKMTDGYEAVYQKLLQAQLGQNGYDHGALCS